MYSEKLNEAPIGIFDSGIGGLSIAKAIKETLPNEQIIYFGDTAHMPYGEKSAEAISQYIEGIAHYLKLKSCKALVVACNSASSVLPHMNVPDFDPDLILNVIDPVVEKLSTMETIQRLGVIGTKKTVLSGVYENRIHALDSSKDVVALPTPLLAPMIEEGYFNDHISSAIIHAYLDYPDFKNIDALVLGCTHYPLIRKQIQEYMGEQVALYDATTLIPEQLKSLLKERGLLRTSASELSDHFYVSDYTVSFENAARIFFGTKIKLEKADIWAL